MSQLGSLRLSVLHACLLLAACLCVLAPRQAVADGLIFKLPADGTSVVYNMKLEAERGPTTGTLTVSSVGRTGSGKAARRWIEFKMVMTRGERSRIVRAKLLIPEANLGRGQASLANAVKGYQKMQDNAVVDIDLKAPKNLGPLPAFLSGPLTGQKDVKPAEVSSSLGKLQCAGVAGKMVLKDRLAKVLIDVEHRLHDKAPFGVVQSKMQFEVERNGERREGGTMILTIAKVAMGAKTELPDSN